MKKRKKNMCKSTMRRRQCDVLEKRERKTAGVVVAEDANRRVMCDIRND